MKRRTSRRVVIRLRVAPQVRSQTGWWLCLHKQPPVWFRSKGEAIDAAVSALESITARIVPAPKRTPSTPPPVSGWLRNSTLNEP